MRETANAELEALSERACDAMRAVFERSARECTLLERTIEIAGREVRLRLAGESAAGWIDPALGHLVSQSRGGSPKLTIHLFSGEPGGAGDSSAAGHISSSADGRFLRQRVGGCDYMLDRTERQLLGSIGRMDDIPSWERVKPLSVPLTAWLNDEGLTVVHAGLVSFRGDGVLFAGPSGAGKSTCALACAASGFDFLGDDCIILDLRPPDDCHGYSLYATGALDGAHLSKFASSDLLTAAAGTASRGKKMIALNGTEHVRTARQSRIRAIVLPRLTQAPRSLLRPAAKGETLRSLGPSSILKRAAPASRTLSQLAALVNMVPGYWLDMSHNPADIPHAIAALIGGTLAP